MNSNYAILVALAVIAVIGGVIYVVYNNPAQPSATATPTGTFVPGAQMPQGQAGSTVSPQASPTQGSPTPTQTGTGSTAVRTISVSGNEFVFNPPDIRVKAGERVQIVFTNIGRMPHDLQIPDLNAGTGPVPLRGGQSKTFEFRAPAQKNLSGYRTLCSVPGHAERGMVGRLIVE